MKERLKALVTKWRCAAEQLEDFCRNVDAKDTDRSSERNTLNECADELEKLFTEEGREQQ